MVETVTAVMTERRASIATIGDGALCEAVDRAIDRAIADACDPLECAESARSVTLTIKIEPSRDRSEARISYDVRLRTPKTEHLPVLVRIATDENGDPVAMEKVRQQGELKFDDYVAPEV